MANKLVGFPGAAMALAVAFLTGGSPAGCGGSDAGQGRESNEAVCGRLCDKAALCAQTANAATCKQSCIATAGTKLCKNQTAIVGALDACLAKDCAGYQDCLKMLPACESGALPDGAVGTGGTGGVTGSGGTGGIPTGMGGSGGGASGGNGGGTGGSGGQPAEPGCEVCVKYDACCVASLPAGVPPAACAMATTCNSVTGPTRDQVAEICKMALASFADDPTAPAACK
jgi:hypothetical protein